MEKKLTSAQNQLMKAVEVGDLDAVKKIVEGGTDPNFDTGSAISASPLYLAALNGDFDMVKWLVDEGGAKINEDTAAFFSVGIGNITIGNFVAQRVIERDKPKK